MRTMTVLSIFWSITFVLWLQAMQGIIPLIYGHVGILGMIFLLRNLHKVTTEMKNGFSDGRKNQSQACRQNKERLQVGFRKEA